MFSRCRFACWISLLATGALLTVPAAAWGGPGAGGGGGFHGAGGYGGGYGGRGGYGYGGYGGFRGGYGYGWGGCGWGWGCYPCIGIGCYPGYDYGYGYPYPYPYAYPAAAPAPVCAGAPPAGSPPAGPEMAPMPAPAGPGNTPPPAPPGATMAPSSATYQAYYQPSAGMGDQVAHLEIRAPSADATIWLNGVPMAQTGTVRHFKSPPITPGASYSYEIRAQWNDNGQMVEAHRTIVVHANDRIGVDMRALTRRQINSNGE